MTVEEASDRFSALEVVQWVAFFRIQKAEMKKQQQNDTSDED